MEGERKSARIKNRSTMKSCLKKSDSSMSDSTGGSSSVDAKNKDRNTAPNNGGASSEAGSKSAKPSGGSGKTGKNKKRNDADSIDMNQDQDESSDKSNRDESTANIEPQLWEGITDMDLVSPLMENDFCNFEDSDAEELLNALSDDEGMDLALDHFEEQDRIMAMEREEIERLNQQQQGGQGGQGQGLYGAAGPAGGGQMHHPAPLRQRCHSDPLLNHFTDNDYFFNNSGGLGGFGESVPGSNQNIDRDHDRSAFHPSVFPQDSYSQQQMHPHHTHHNRGGPSPFHRHASAGETQPGSARGGADIGDDGMKRRGDKTKPRRKVRKNRTLKDGRGGGAGGDLFRGYARSNTGGEDTDDGFSDVASACSAPADLLEGGFFDDPTAESRRAGDGGVGGGVDIHALFMNRRGGGSGGGGGRKSGGGGGRNRGSDGDSGDESYEYEEQQQQRSGHRRRKSAPLVTEFWNDDNNQGVGQGGLSRYGQQHPNQHDPRHPQAPAPLKRRKSDPLISISDFWRTGQGQYHNHSNSHNQGGNVGNNNNHNAQRFLQNISAFEQSSNTERELSNIIAVAREAQDKINRLKALLSGAPPSLNFGNMGGGPGGPPSQPGQMTGRGGSGGGFSYPPPPQYGPGGNGPHQFPPHGRGMFGPQHQQPLQQHHGMSRSMPNNGDEPMDGNALARSAAHFASPQAVMSKSSSPKGSSRRNNSNNSKSSSSKKQSEASNKKKRTPKKSPARPSASSKQQPHPQNNMALPPNNPTAIPKSLPDIPIPQIDPATLSKLDPEAVMASLQAAMEKTKDTQQQLQEWDRANGLPKSHSQTMVNSSRSRKQLEEGVILKKWNGTPLIDTAERKRIEQEQRRLEEEARLEAEKSGKGKGGRGKGR